MTSISLDLIVLVLGDSVKLNVCLGASDVFQRELDGCAWKSCAFQEFKGDFVIAFLVSPPVPYLFHGTELLKLCYWLRSTLGWGITFNFFSFFRKLGEKYIWWESLSLGPLSVLSMKEHAVVLQWTAFLGEGILGWLDIFISKVLSTHLKRQ